jgi:hypothetical protein
MKRFAFLFPILIGMYGPDGGPPPFPPGFGSHPRADPRYYGPPPGYNDRVDDYWRSGRSRDWRNDRFYPGPGPYR